mgnify:CR=1 FL=1
MARLTLLAIIAVNTDLRVDVFMRCACAIFVIFFCSSSARPEGFGASLRENKIICYSPKPSSLGNPLQANLPF